MPAISLEQVTAALNHVADELQPLLPLANCHMVDFFTSNAWERLLPPDLAEDLDAVDPDLLCRVLAPLGQESATVLGRLEVQCPTLHEFLMLIHSLHLSSLGVLSTRQQVYECAGVASGCEVAPVPLGRLMKEKKSHEVTCMSQLLATLSNELQVSWLCDVGAGKGYLSCVMARQYGLNVLGIDCCSGNVKAAAAYQRTLQGELNHQRKLRKKEAEARNKINNNNNNTTDTSCSNDTNKNTSNSSSNNTSNSSNNNRRGQYHCIAKFIGADFRVGEILREVLMTSEVEKQKINKEIRVNNNNKGEKNNNNGIGNSVGSNSKVKKDKRQKRKEKSRTNKDLDAENTSKRVLDHPQLPLQMASSSPVPQLPSEPQPSSSPVPQLPSEPQPSSSSVPQLPSEPQPSSSPVPKFPQSAQPHRLFLSGLHTCGDLASAMLRATFATEENAVEKNCDAKVTQNRACTKEGQNISREDQNADIKGENMVKNDKNRPKQDQNVAVKDENRGIEEEKITMKDQKTILEDQKTTKQDQKTILEDESPSLDDENLVKEGRIIAACNVGCCYHLLTEAFEEKQARWWSITRNMRITGDTATINGDARENSQSGHKLTKMGNIEGGSCKKIGKNSKKTVMASDVLENSQNNEGLSSVNSRLENIAGNMRITGDTATINGDAGKEKLLNNEDKTSVLGDFEENSLSKTDIKSVRFSNLNSILENVGESLEKNGDTTLTVVSNFEENYQNNKDETKLSAITAAPTTLSITAETTIPALTSPTQSILRTGAASPKTEVIEKEAATITTKILTATTTVTPAMPRTTAITAETITQTTIAESAVKSTPRTAAITPASIIAPPAETITEFSVKSTSATVTLAATTTISQTSITTATITKSEVKSTPKIAAITPASTISPTSITAATTIPATITAPTPQSATTIVPPQSATTAPSSSQSGFPLSGPLLSRGYSLGRNARMLAAQPVARIAEGESINTRSQFWRALLQLHIVEKLHQTHHEVCSKTAPENLRQAADSSKESGDSCQKNDLSSPRNDSSLKNGDYFQNRRKSSIFSTKSQETSINCTSYNNNSTSINNNTVSPVCCCPMEEEERRAVLSFTVGRRLASQCQNFPQYVDLATQLLPDWLRGRVQSPHHSSPPPPQDPETSYPLHHQRLCKLFALRAGLAPVVEGLILLDRLVFALEQESCSAAFLLPLFDPLLSPRCHALVILKQETKR